MQILILLTLEKLNGIINVKFYQVVYQKNNVLNLYLLFYKTLHCKKSVAEFLQLKIIYSMMCEECTILRNVTLYWQEKQNEIPVYDPKPES